MKLACISPPEAQLVAFTKKMEELNGGKKVEPEELIKTFLMVARIPEGFTIFNMFEY